MDVMSPRLVVKYPEVDVSAWRERIYKNRYMRMSKSKDEVIKIINSHAASGAVRQWKSSAVIMLLRSTCKRFLLCLNKAEKELATAKRQSRNNMTVKRIMVKFDERMFGFSDTILDRLSTAKIVLAAQDSRNGSPNPEYDEFLDSLLRDMLVQNRKFEMFEQKFDTLRRSYSE